MVWIIIGGIIGAPVLAALVVWVTGERGRLLRRTTRVVLRESGIESVFNLRAIHMYVYGRWTAKYISVLRYSIYPYLGERGKKWLRERYHAKVLRQEDAESIIMLNKDVPLQDLEKVIPYPIARQIVLDGPPDVVAYECGCRNSKPVHCEPSQVCMVIGKPFTDFMLEHMPDSTRRLTQEEAITLLREEHERGHMHTAWFKDACIDRFYSICNCCKCCCFGIESMKRYGNPCIASSGYVAQIDENLCTVCGACIEACPFDALSIAGEKIVMDWEKCMGCGVCEAVCPTGARTMVADERKGIPLDVTVLTGGK